MTTTIDRVPPENKAWGPQHVANYLGVSERHVRDVRREDRTFPPPRMVGNKPRWAPDAVPAWVASGGTATVTPVPPRKRKGPGRVQ